MEGSTGLNWVLLHYPLTCWLIFQAGGVSFGNSHRNPKKYILDGFASITRSKLGTTFRGEEK